MKPIIIAFTICVALLGPTRVFALDANQQRACRWSGGNGETPAELAAVFDTEALSAPSNWYFYEFAPNVGVAVHFYATVSGELAASRIVTYGYDEPDWWAEPCRELRVPSRWEASN